jgi:hypothetical protein
MQMFSRLDIASEILSDQGTQFKVVHPAWTKIEISQERRGQFLSFQGQKVAFSIRFYHSDRRFNPGNFDWEKRRCDIVQLSVFWRENLALDEVR